MQVTKQYLSPTKVKLTIIAGDDLLKSVKEQTLRALAKDMKIPGFRPGKLPLPIVEKNADPNLLQSEFVDRAMNQMYGLALDQEKLRPVARPEANVTKFVPFDSLEIEAEVEVIGVITLPDYKMVRIAVEPVEVTAKDLSDVLDQLRVREAEKKNVERSAKDGDQVWIDFKGVDPKTGDPVQGADGEQYPLVLGSNTFIPGFEPKLIGMKAGEDKVFPIIFPDDYGVSSLQKVNVEFSVTVTKVQEVVRPELNDEFAAKIGPFKNMDDLKTDIEGQINYEKQLRSDREYQSRLLENLTDAATVEIPDALINEEIDRLEKDERRDVVYRGQTWQEHLTSEGVTEAEHRTKKRPEAEKRVKAGLVIAEIAEAEKLDITAEELDGRLNSHKAQHSDKAMRIELEKPENRREIASRLLTEKTIALLVGYASSK